MTEGDYYEEAEEAQSNAPAVVAMFLAALIICAIFAIDRWLEPPKVVFPAPPPPKINYYSYSRMPLGIGWRGDCLIYDGINRVVFPNLSDPACSQASLRKRYASHR